MKFKKIKVLKDVEGSIYSSNDKTNKYNFIQGDVYGVITDCVVIQDSNFQFCPISLEEYNEHIKENLIEEIN